MKGMSKVKDFSRCFIKILLKYWIKSKHGLSYRNIQHLSVWGISSLGQLEMSRNREWRVESLGSHDIIQMALSGSDVTWLQTFPSLLCGPHLWYTHHVAHSHTCNRQLQPVSTAQVTTHQNKHWGLPHDLTQYTYSPTKFSLVYFLKMFSTFYFKAKCHTPMWHTMA